jgi:hypothetical protein
VVEGAEAEEQGHRCGGEQRPASAGGHGRPEGEERRGDLRKQHEGGEGARERGEGDAGEGEAQEGDAGEHRRAQRQQQGGGSGLALGDKNWAFSVEPTRARVEALPPVMTSDTWSK